MHRCRFRGVVAGVAGETSPPSPPLNYYTLSAYPTRTGTTSYVTNNNASGAGSFAQALTDRAAGGIIAIDPALTIDGQSITSNPTGMVYITSGTSGGGLVTQTLPAKNYARNTRATIGSVALAGNVTNITLMSVNIGSETAYLGGLVTGQSATSYPDLNMYGCELFGMPILPTSYPIQVVVVDATGIAVNDTVTGGTSGTIALVKAKSTNTLYLHITTVGGGGTRAAPFVVSETLGSSTVSSQTSWPGLYGVQLSWNKISVQGNYFHDLANCFKVTGVALNGTSAVEVLDNDFDNYYEDAIFFSMASSNTPTSLKVDFNRCTRPIGNSADIDNPHCDFLQFSFSGAGATANYNNWYVRGNIGINGFTDGNSQGIPFMNGQTTGTVSIKTVGNMFLYYQANGGTVNFVIERPKNCYTFGNRMGRYIPGAGTGNIARTISGSQGGNFDTFNTYENAGGGLDASGNYNLLNSDASYEGMYAGASAGSTFPLSAATAAAAITEAQTAFNWRASGDFGSIRDYVDWTNKRIVLDMEPKKLVFSTQAGLVTSTLTATEWRKYWGGVSAAISISAGWEYQIANTDGGAPTVTWTSAAGTITEGQWVQMRATTSASAGTAVTGTLTIGTDTSTVSLVTASADTFAAVDNGATRYAQGSMASTITARKGILAIRYKRDIHTNSQVLYSSSATGLRIYYPGANSQRNYIFSGSTGRVANWTGAATADGAWRTMILYFDTLADSVGAGGVVLVEEGSQKTLSQGSWTATASGTVATGFPGILDDPGGAGVTLDGGVKFVWAHFWDGTGVDPFIGINIADAGFWSKFYSEQIGANGEGPLGYTPQIYYTGNAAAWESGLVNLGTVSDTLTNGGAGAWT